MHPPLVNTILQRIVLLNFSGVPKENFYFRCNFGLIFLGPFHHDVGQGNYNMRPKTMRKTFGKQSQNEKTRVDGRHAHVQNTATPDNDFETNINQKKTSRNNFLTPIKNADRVEKTQDTTIYQSPN